MDNISPKIIRKILDDYRNSEDYKDILTSYRYYNNNQDILDKKRLAIGAIKGTREEVNNLPNNKIMNNLYSVLVD